MTFFAASCDRRFVLLLVPFNTMKAIFSQILKKYGWVESIHGKVREINVRKTFKPIQILESRCSYVLWKQFSAHMSGSAFDLTLLR